MKWVVSGLCSRSSEASEVGGVGSRELSGSKASMRRGGKAQALGGVSKAGEQREQSCGEGGECGKVWVGPSWPP